MLRKQFEHSGVQDATYGDVPSNSDLHISGVGSVTLNSINANVTIIKSGVGPLRIDGFISEENVRIIISGVGNVYFAIQPPQSVRIEKSGVGQIYVTGKKFSTPFSIHSQLSEKRPHAADDKKDSASMILHALREYAPAHRDNHDSDADFPGLADAIRASTVEAKAPRPSAPIAHSAPIHRDNHDSDANFPGLADAIRASMAEAKAARPSAPIAHPLPDDKKFHGSDKSAINSQQYSKHMQNYIATFENKELLSKRIEKVLQLMPEAEERFAKLVDPISEDYMDIPVSLNEVFYNLNTLASNQAKRDPFTQELFALTEIQSARQLYNEADELIKQLMNEYQEKQKIVKDADEAHDEEIPIAPGGPGFRRGVG
jgi:hypothetical protein